MSKLNQRIIVLLLIFSFISQSLWINAEEISGHEVSVEGIYQSWALQNLLRQVGEKFREEDSIQVLVEINDAFMQEEYGWIPAEKERLLEEQEIEKQISYARGTQQILKEKLEDLKISYQVVEEFDVVLNALELEVSFADAKRIAGLKEVQSIIYNDTLSAPEKPFEPRVFRSQIQVEELRNEFVNKYRGKKQLVAILDTGIDVDHEIFQSQTEENSKITSRQALETIKAKNKINYGEWKSMKIPFAYNYSDRNNIVKENDHQSHGMHVAGIVGGNGINFKGVAPDVQIAFMRVFSEGKDGKVSNYAMAIEDAVKLGADSINMSLGFPGGAEKYLYPALKRAIQTAKKAGVAIAIAAGNSGFAGWGALGIDYPDAKNPDYGILGSPAVVQDSIAVASVESSQIYGNYLLLEDLGKKIIYLETDSKNYPYGQAVEYVDGGYGSEAELGMVQGGVRGKYVLVQRGDRQGGRTDFTYAEKIENAKKAQAEGIIVYNNISHAPISEMDVKGTNLPALSISKEDGEALLSHAAKKNQAGEIPQIVFVQEKGFLENQLGDTPSDFSSWGLTADMEIKPDISAPGGKIYSSFNDNQYGVLNGTSMAAPHIAAAIAIVKEYVEAEFPNISGEEKSKRIKNLLMSTAKPYKQTEDAFSSPRKQGAGLVQLKNAVHSYVTLEGNKGISSINLGELSGNQVEIRGTIHNHGTVSKTFSYHAVLATDSVRDGKIILRPRFLKKSQERQITVEPNASAEFALTLELEQSLIEGLKAEMPNGFFLEGFVFFADSKDDGTASPHPNLSIPFVGFYGKWQQIPIIEKSVYDLLENAKLPFFFYQSTFVPAFTHLGSTLLGKNQAINNIILGHMPDSTMINPKFQKDAIAFSPNQDGQADFVQFYGTFLRDYEDVSLTIQTADNAGTAIYNIREAGNSGIKNYYDPSNGVFTRTSNNWRWDGRTNQGERVADGNYLFKIEVEPISDSTERQSISLPVKVDTFAPFLVSALYNDSEKQLTVTRIEETGSGVREMFVDYAEGNLADTKVLLNQVTVLASDFNQEKAKLVLIDHAFNQSEIPFAEAIKRNGNKYRIELKTSSGKLDDVRWKIYKVGNDTTPLSSQVLEAGRYYLQVEVANPRYELIGSNRIEFEVGNNEFVKVVQIPIQEIVRKAVYVTVQGGIPQGISLYWRNKTTQEVVNLQLEMDNSHPNRYVNFLRNGSYQLELKNSSTTKKKLDRAYEVEISASKGVQAFDVRIVDSESTPIPNPPKPPVPAPKPPVPAPKPPVPPAPNPSPAPNLPAPNQPLPAPNLPAPKQPLPVPNPNKPLPPKKGEPLKKTEEKKTERHIQQKAYVKGYRDGRFLPENTLKRAEIAVMLNRFLETENSKEQHLVKDIKPSDWYFAAIQNMVTNKIVSGYPDGSYRPENFVSRAELITMLIKMKGISLVKGNGKVNFTDLEEAGWAKDAILYAGEQGWIKGFADGSVRPNKQVTRAEAVVMINRAFGFTSSPNSGIRFSDVSENHWAYQEIVTATN